MGKKRIVVTGGRGMIGIELLGQLDEKYPDAEIVEADLKNAVPTDLRCFNTCKELCKGVDEVYNLVGIKGSALMTKERPVDFMAPMLQFDTNMITAAQEMGVKKFLYTSSITVLYPDVDVYPAWVKSTAEKLIEAMRIQYPKGTEYCIVRPSSVYGRYDDFDNPNAMVITSLISKALTANVDLLEVWGDGTQTRDFINAEDVAKAMILVMEKMPNEPINVGSGYEAKIKNIADLIAGECRINVKYDPSKQVGSQNRPMEVSKLYKLGFQPKYKFIADGLKEVIKNVKASRNNNASKK